VRSKEDELTPFRVVCPACCQWVETFPYKIKWTGTGYRSLFRCICGVVCDLASNLESEEDGPSPIPKPDVPSMCD
jgi:hypothetical protein